MAAYIDDPTISWKAKGLYAAALVKIESGEFTRDKLVKMSKDGQVSVSKGVKELIEAGYISQERVREGGRFVGSKWSVAEVK